MESDPETIEDPLYNPYTKIVDGKRVIEPVTGEAYLDREADFNYYPAHLFVIGALRVMMGGGSIFP